MHSEYGRAHLGNETPWNHEQHRTQQECPVVKQRIPRAEFLSSAVSLSPTFPTLSFHQNKRSIWRNKEVTQDRGEEDATVIPLPQIPAQSLADSMTLGDFTSPHPSFLICKVGIIIASSS